MAETIQIHGFAELIADLRTLPDKLQKKAVKDSVRAGAKLILKEARKRAPKSVHRWEGAKVNKVPPGTLRKGIKIARATKQPKWIVRDIIGFTKKAWYGRLVEEGHKWVVGGTLAGGKKRRKTKGLPVTRGGRPTTSGQGRVVKHISAKPFLRPAFDANVDKTINIMRKTLGDGIKKMKFQILTVK